MSPDSSPELPLYWPYPGLIRDLERFQVWLPTRRHALRARRLLGLHLRTGRPPTPDQVRRARRYFGRNLRSGQPLKRHLRRKN